MNSTNATTLYTLRPSDYYLLSGQAILFATAVLLCVGTCVFRNTKIMKSRGLIPYLSLVVFTGFLIRIIFQLLSVFDVKEATSISSKFPCYWLLLSQAPLISLFVIVVIFTCLRFMLTNFLKQKQEDIYKLKDSVHHQMMIVSSGSIQKLDEFEKTVETKASKISLGIKFIKVALSEWIALPFMVAFYVFWNVVQVIVLVSSEAALKTKCMFLTPDGESIQTYMNISSSLIILGLILFGIGMVLSDSIIYFIRKKECDIIGYFKEDKLFFRLEFIFIVLAGTLGGLAQTIIPFIKSSLNEWVSKTVVLLIEALLLYVFSGNILLISIIQTISQKRRIIDPTSLLEVLKEKKGLDLFSKYTKLEWSQENLLLYHEIQKYKELDSYKLRFKRSAEIYRTYISSNAPIQVNLPHNVQKSYHESMETLKEGDTTGWTEIFKDVEGEVLANLRDSFTRFTSTGEYKNWAKQFQTK